MNRKKVTIILLIVVLLSVSAWFIIRNLTGADETGEESNFSAVEALPGSVSIRVEGPSVIEPFQTRNIRSAIDGIIVLVAGEGDSVEAGDILVSFDGSDKERVVQQSSLNLYKAELNRERNLKTLDKTRKSLEDSRQLFQSGAISKEQVDAAESVVETAVFNYESSKLDVSQALLSLEVAKKDLENVHVRASFSGVVLSSEVLTGDLVNKGTVIMTFADLSKLRLKAEVDEFDIGKVQVGQKVTVSSDSLGDEVLGSRVERVSPAAEVINNISIFTVSTVLQNTDGLLKPGMSADLSILISSDKGLIIPSKAVSSVRSRSYVKVYINKEIETRKVTVGSDDGVNIVVLEGLEEGEYVVIPTAPGFQLTSSSSQSSGTSVIPVSIPGAGAR